MEPQAAFVRSDGTVHLNSESSIHLNGTLIIHPENPKLNHTFRFNDPFHNTGHMP